MLIAIDFDDTLTMDAALWRAFVDACKSLGHQVVCVTARRDTDDNNETIDSWMHSHGLDLRVYYSALGSKVEYMKNRGLKVDIWIDDDPRKCAMGH
jgi:hydroxymethylpyrimidine pyrophosphatase-like HAD family hydrolase